jgi:hypothetical protein
VQIIPEPELLPDIRSLLSRCPELVNYPERLAAKLEAEEQAVCACLEAVRDERGEVLA